MSMLQKRFLLCLAFMGMIQPSLAYFSIGTKGRSNGSAIHSSYFLTPNNQAFVVSATAYAGTWTNGACLQNTAIYQLGNDLLQTGNFVDIDAFQLKAVIGGGYSCLMVFYTYKQQVNETIQLSWDGFNYTASTPMQSEITIL